MSLCVSAKHLGRLPKPHTRSTQSLLVSPELWGTLCLCICGVPVSLHWKMSFMKAGVVFSVLPGSPIPRIRPGMRWALRGPFFFSGQHFIFSIAINHPNTLLHLHPPPCPPQLCTLSESRSSFSFLFSFWLNPSISPATPLKFMYFLNVYFFPHELSILSLLVYSGF